MWRAQHEVHACQRSSAAQAQGPGAAVPNPTPHHAPAVKHVAALEVDSGQAFWNTALRLLNRVRREVNAGDLEPLRCKVRGIVPKATANIQDAAARGEEAQTASTMAGCGPSTSQGIVLLLLSYMRRNRDDGGAGSAIVKHAWGT